MATVDVTRSRRETIFEVRRPLSAPGRRRKFSYLTTQAVFG